MPESDPAKPSAGRQGAPSRTANHQANGYPERPPGEYALLGLVCWGAVLGGIGVVMLSVPVALAGALAAAVGLAGFRLRERKGP